MSWKRALAYLFIILMAIALIWAIVAHLDAGIKSASIGFWSMILGSAWGGLTTGWYNLMKLASANGTAFLVYTLVIALIISPILLFGILKLWAGRPKLFGRAKTAASSAASSVASTVRSSTPVGATTRPTTTTATVTPTSNVTATVEVPEEEVKEA